MRVEKSVGTNKTEYIEKYTEVNSGNPIYHIFFGEQRIASFDSSGSLSHIHQNHQQSTVLRTDSSGNVVFNQKYFPFGESRSGTALNGDLNSLYTDQYYDNESEVYYYKNRYYLQNVGRFASADMLYLEEMNERGTRPLEMNVYSYVGNDPVNMLDPSGLKSYGIGFSFSFTFAVSRIDAGVVARVAQDETKSKFDLSSYSVGLHYSPVGDVNHGDVAENGYEVGVSGFHVDAGVDLVTSNADNVSQLTGKKFDTGGSLGKGGDIGTNLTTSILDEKGNVKKNNSGVPITEMSFSFGGGLGAEGHINAPGENKEIGTIGVE